jgi:hypothetical protein
MNNLAKFINAINRANVVWNNEMWDAFSDLNKEYQDYLAKKLADTSLSPADMRRAKNTPWHDKASY